MLNCCLRRATSTASLNADFAGAPVYRCRTNGTIKQGFSFTVIGKIPADGNRFIIDFNTNNLCNDVALRLACRASTNTLGRNSLISYNWGVEETSLENPFHLVKTKEFKIEIFFTDDYILFAFDSIHVAKYKHRVDFRNIYNIEVRGEIADLNARHKFSFMYPQHLTRTPQISFLCGHEAKKLNMESDEESEALNEGEQQFLPLPYFAVFMEGFLKEDYSINIIGHVSADPKLIKVALQDNPCVWPEPTIEMQMEICFTEKRDAETDEPLIVFSSFINDEWSDDVKPEVVTNLRPGDDFNLLIVLRRLAFEVHLNNKHLLDHRYFLKPRYVTTCLVEGDLQLFDVIIKGD